MERIRIARLICCNIIRRDTLRKRNGSEQTSLGCLDTPTAAEPMQRVLQMAAVTPTSRLRDGNLLVLPSTAR